MMRWGRQTEGSKHFLVIVSHPNKHYEVLMVHPPHTQVDMLRNLSFAADTSGADAMELVRLQPIQQASRLLIKAATESALVTAARGFITQTSISSARAKRVAVVVLPDSAAGPPRLLSFTRAALPLLNAHRPSAAQFELVELIQRETSVPSR
jgi:hypothetical protein